MYAYDVSSLCTQKEYQEMQERKTEKREKSRCKIFIVHAQKQVEKLWILQYICMVYQRIVVGANELWGIGAKTKTKGVAGKWQVNLGPIRPVAGKSAWQSMDR